MEKLKKEAIADLEEYIMLIHDCDIRSNVRGILYYSHFESWYYISASRKKHHHVSDRGIGGLLHHIKSCVKVAIELFRTENFSEYQKDIIIASLLLHDLAKPDGEIKDHPERMYDYITNLNDFKGKNDIARLVLIHMGRWGKNTPQNNIEHFVHICDYIASRDFIYIS